jgi:dTDP-4-dehydrorhamnose reductase
MARMLVTGATGLLGTTLVPLLAARGHVITRHARSAAADLRFDLTDRAATRAGVARAAPEVVINLAALTDVDRCEADPPLAYTQNVRSVENLCSALEEHGGTFLVHISTDQLYDGAGPHAEDDVRLTNYYAYSKRMGELVAERVAAAILRTNFFGRSRAPGRTSLSDWIESKLEAGEPLTVFSDVLFTPLAIESLSANIALAAERRLAGLFNLGSRDGMSKADFAFRVAETLGMPATRMKRGRSSDARLGAYRPTDMRMDSSRFESAFGVRLPRLEDEISTLRSIHHA